MTSKKINICLIVKVLLLRRIIVIRNGKIVWKHGPSLCYIEIYQAAQNTKKNMAFPEGNKLFVDDLGANLDERNADMVQFTKR